MRRGKQEKHAEKNAKIKEARRARRNAKRRQKRADAAAQRHDLLANMTTEERIEYVRNEWAAKDAAKAATADRLEDSMHHGRLKVCFLLEFMHIMSFKVSDQFVCSYVQLFVGEEIISETNTMGI